MEEEFTPQITFVGKTVEEYNLYTGQEDFYLKIKKFHTHDPSDMYFVIYEDAQERCVGNLMSGDEIYKLFKITPN